MGVPLLKKRKKKSKIVFFFFVQNWQEIKKKIPKIFDDSLVLSILLTKNAKKGSDVLFVG